MDHAEEQGHVVPYRTLVKVWLLLLILTAVLVFVSTTFHEALPVAALLTLTPLKAGLVFFYFAGGFPALPRPPATTPARS